MDLDIQRVPSYSREETDCLLAHDIMENIDEITIEQEVWKKRWINYGASGGREFAVVD